MKNVQYSIRLKIPMLTAYTDAFRFNRSNKISEDLTITQC